MTRGRTAAWLALAVLAAGVVWLTYYLVMLQISCRHVLEADPATLTRLGRHIVVGFRDKAELDALLKRGAIGGVYITVRNLEDMPLEDARQLILDIRARAPGPLRIMADQEGGGVSRLSPPLEHQPALAEILKESAPAKQEQAVRAYARAQAQGMRSMGLDMNLAPVVDVSHGNHSAADLYTRIEQRALSGDPALVARAAGWYCDELAQNGVQCTLKHFPGLGRVSGDTHVTDAELDAPLAELQASDWLPFRQLMQQGYPVMLSHVRLTALDDTQPVSTSAKVVEGLLRQQWHYDGIIITDDFSMRAISGQPGGVGAAAVKSLNAGADLILISFRPELYYPAMEALLEADRNGQLDKAKLAASEQRLARTLPPHDAARPRGEAHSEKYLKR